jgi:hypothetical protein
MLRPINLVNNYDSDSDQEQSSFLDANLSPPPPLPPILRRQNAIIINDIQCQARDNKNISSSPTIKHGKQNTRNLSHESPVLNTYMQRRLSREIYILNDQNGQQSDNQNTYTQRRRQNMPTVQLPPIILQDNVSDKQTYNNKDIKL